MQLNGVECVPVWPTHVIKTRSARLTPSGKPSEAYSSAVVCKYFVNVL